MNFFFLHVRVFPYMYSYKDIYYLNYTLNIQINIIICNVESFTLQILVNTILAKLVIVLTFLFKLVSVNYE